jgi:hypothetical protein
MDLTVGCYIAPPLKKSHPEILEQKGCCKRGYTRTSLRREELQILGTEKVLGLPCDLLLGMMTPLNLEESNHLTPCDSVLLIQNFHCML